jgi:DNA-binding CsgD family transcriptional regulator
VWSLAARGLSNREIAEALQISSNRVKHSLRRVHAALGDESREALEAEFRRLVQRYDEQHPTPKRRTARGTAS